MAKNNKTTARTIERQAAFAAEFGGDYKTIAAPSAEFRALCAELIGDDREAAANRRADEGLPGFRQNSPETYRVRFAERLARYCGNGVATVHGRGAVADCDVEEKDLILAAPSIMTDDSAAVLAETAGE